VITTGLLFISTMAFSAENIREPAVAGLFYPASAIELSATLNKLLASAPAKALPTGKLRAIMCPHAGYDYSAATAAQSYQLLPGREFDTVVLLSPSHTAFLNSASVSNASAYRTPLGDMKLSAKARVLARLPPFALQPPCDVRRPQWWAQSRISAPLPQDDRADTWEHSGEVQVPFLQKTLPQAQLIPVVMGDLDPQAAARALSSILDDKTLIVVSTDLSHFHPYKQAREIDNATVKAICRLDTSSLAPEMACGYIPVLTLLHLARERGWEAVLLDQCNSGDTSGDKSRVVGYAAIAFFEGTKSRPTSDRVSAPRQEAAMRNYSDEERRILISLARQALVEAADSDHPLRIPERGLPEKLRASRACFVTLSSHGSLRGCIGNIAARAPLYQAVIDNARSAALKDPRFSPVEKGELPGIEVEVSVLTPPLPLSFTSPEDLLSKLVPKRDGVVLQIEGSLATYLPQVWEQIPDKTEFLDSLAMKAGWFPGAWKKPGTRVLIYQAEAFKESEYPSGPVGR
jgi:AmmeMemoRadiSam system protein A